MYHRKVQIESLSRQFLRWSFYGADVTLPTLEDRCLHCYREKHSLSRDS